MRGPVRWCITMGAVGGIAAGCHGAPWQRVAPSRDACVQRSAIQQEIATLDAKLRKGEFPASPPVLIAASAAGGGSAGGPMGGSANAVNLERRAEAASASDGGASPQAASNVALAQAAYVADENARRDRQAVANVAGISTAGSAVAPASVTSKQAATPQPATREQAQARIKLLQKQLWDLPTGASCAKLAEKAS